MCNEAKHPRFIIDPTPRKLGTTTEADRAAAHEALYAGIDLDRPVFTNDGDYVRLLAIDGGHTFPLVGEIVDLGAETSWLARWSASGVYASSSDDARTKHSLRLNSRPGENYLAPLKTKPFPDITAPARVNGVDEPNGTDCGDTVSGVVDSRGRVLVCGSSDAADAFRYALAGALARRAARGEPPPVPPSADDEPVGGITPGLASQLRATDPRDPEFIAGCKQVIFHMTDTYDRHPELAEVGYRSGIGRANAIRAQYRAAYETGRISKDAYVHMLAATFAVLGQLRVDGDNRETGLVVEALEQAVGLLSGPEVTPASIARVTVQQRIPV